MDQAERDHIQRELEGEANELFPGWIRRVELLQHDDAPTIEPGQLMPRLVFKDPAARVQDRDPDPRKVAKAFRTFKLAVGPGLNQFRDDLLERWPEIRYIEVIHEDDSGQPFALIGMTIREDKITEIDILADPERLSRLDLTGLIP